MSTYALNDFSETLQRVTLPSPPAECVRAWGESVEGPGCDWKGGFLLRLQDGTFAYISGWCDYAGWGCQDGAHVTLGATPDALDIQSEDHERPLKQDSWDELPSDLNRWIAGGMKSDVDLWNDIGVKDGGRYAAAIAACRAVVDANDHGMRAEEGRRAVELCRAVVADAEKRST